MKFYLEKMAQSSPKESLVTPLWRASSVMLLSSSLLWHAGSIVTRLFWSSETSYSKRLKRRESFCFLFTGVGAIRGVMYYCMRIFFDRIQNYGTRSHACFLFFYRTDFVRASTIVVIVTGQPRERRRRTWRSALTLRRPPTLESSFQHMELGGGGGSGGGGPSSGCSDAAAVAVTVLVPLPRGWDSRRPFAPSRSRRPTLTRYPHRPVLPAAHAQRSGGVTVTAVSPPRSYRDPGVSGPPNRTSATPGSVVVVRGRRSFIVVIVDRDERWLWGEVYVCDGRGGGTEKSVRIRRPTNRVRSDCWVEMNVWGVRCVREKIAKIAVWP